MAGDDENIRFEIFIEISQALSAIKTLQREAGGLNAAMAQVGDKFATILKGFSSLNFANVKSYTYNVKTLMQGIKTISDETGTSIQDVGKVISQNFQNIPKVAITDAIKGLNNELKGVQDNSGKAVRGLDAVRIALGAIVAMIVFQAIQAIGNFFSSMITGAKDAEMALYRLEKVERILSKEGIAISPQGLAAGIKEIKEQFDFLSDIDISQLLGNVALLTKNLHLTEKQIIDLSKAIINLNINSQDNEDILATSGKVINAMVAGKSQGLGGLGLSFAEVKMQAKAMEMGLLKAGEALSKLTDAQRTQVKLALVLEAGGLEDYNQMLQDSAAYESTLEGKTNTLKNAWDKFTATLGQVATPVLKVYLQIGIVLIKNVLMPAAIAFGQLISVVLTFTSLIAILARGKLPDLIDQFGSLKDAIVGIFNVAQEQMGVNELQNALDTTTGAVSDLTDATDSLDDAMSKINFGDLVKDMADIQNDMAKAQADFDEKMRREAEDFNLSQARAYEDYQRNAREALEDFNRKRHDAEQEYRDREAEAEAKFQEKMRQLRAKYLFDLEDALRARDAGQVLRLMRQYQMEKTNAINEEAIRKQFAAKQHAEDQEKAKQELQDKLDNLAEEYRIKNERAIEDYNIKVQRENEEHAQDMAALRARMDERLMLFAQKAAEELGLKEQGAQAIYEALQKYYGPGGAFDGLYDYSIESAAARAQMLMEMLSQIAGQIQAINNLGNAFRTTTPVYDPGGGLGSTTRTDGGKFAQGGSYLATGPTKALFGDGGEPELATFIPLSKLSGGKPNFKSLGSQAGLNGSLEVLLTLSPDLEARVVNRSLNATADVITRIQRSK